MKKNILLMVSIFWGLHLCAQDTIFITPHVCIDSIKTSQLYACVNTRITTENFPLVVADTGKLVMKVFHFGCRMKKDKVIKKMKKEGYRPATIIELYVYHQRNSDSKYCCPLFALGSSYWGIWNAMDFPYIEYNEKNQYEFSLIPYSENIRRPGFLKECYFLGVQE